MILLDTSVWVDHLRRGDARVETLLRNNSVLAHPWVVGELALGRLVNRHVTLTMLADLPQANQASESEVARFVETRQLYGRGIGYVDVHLLASTLITPGAQLRTRDRRLHTVALDLGCAG
ncbi:MAG: type II toxin-antitoxin system VapC family toxin [Angustibacter sp.]